ncbi:transglycosylase domain-containing protein [Bradyrhizobium arachidis]|uniref:transglycosylase domain-containing protein n=1 Tax=Bradyrhizobium arachidis TaxID=858423 RepID=UPI002163BD98|nr:transglycosylase domain-containing protein [Bradyrhizobium arachidis]UVO30577.1 transglycosylase domain-containing protein [Bradyrhizobium arachidis]
MIQIIPPKTSTIRHCLSARELSFGPALLSYARDLRELYYRYSRFLDGISLGRWQRWLLLEPVSEALTFALCGLLLLLAFAISTTRTLLQEDCLKVSDVTVCLLDRLGGPIGHGVPIPLGDFPDALIKATLATEDRQFYNHLDIDFPGTFHVLLVGAQNGTHQVGSTITQQLARTLLFDTEPSIGHKIKQVLLPVWLEWNLTKDEILRLYLNCVDMGGDTLGVDGAARFYFNKPARDVTLAEAAMLVGLINAPIRYAPHIDLTAAHARANMVLDNLIEAGFMTEDQTIRARHNAAKVIVRRNGTPPN